MFDMGFGRCYRMLRGLGMMPTRGMRMMRRFLVIARLMVFGGFLMMPRGVLMLFGRFLVMLCSLGGHRRSFRDRLFPTMTRFPPQEGDTLHVPSCALFCGHVPSRGMQAALACDTLR
jgi:hypothetical protein